MPSAAACKVQVLLTWLLAAVCSFGQVPPQTSWEQEHAAGMDALKRELFEEAEKHLFIALKEAERFGSQDPRLLQTLDDLADAVKRLEKLRQADRYYRRALALREKVLGNDHPDVGRSCYNLGELYLEQAAVYVGLQTSLKSGNVPLRLPKVPPSDLAPETEMYVYTEGDLKEAERYFKRALTIQEKRDGMPALLLAATLFGMGRVHKYRGEYEDAVPLFERALAMQEKELGRDNAAVFATLKELGETRSRQKNFDQAKTLLRRALAVAEKSSGATGLKAAVVLQDLATLYRSQKRYADAVPLYARVLFIYELKFGTENLVIVGPLEDFADALGKTGQRVAAEGYRERARQIQKRYPNVKIVPRGKPP